ncbi:MAG TPA: four helix bundle protein [Chitinophagaceae bacterium]
MFEHPLEERCHQFGKRVRAFCRKLKKDLANIEDIKQLVRASGSVGANYIEANENVGRGDLKFRLRICRKESKESMHFLGLLELFENKELEKERDGLLDEAV